MNFPTPAAKKKRSRRKPQIGRIGAPLNSEPIPVLQWIEIATSLQIPSFQIIGLPGPEVAEARERVKAALEASGFEFPRRRVVLNLAPASIRKRGTGLDLAMALAVLADLEGACAAGSEGLKLVAWGELGLDGQVKPAGQLTRTLYACWQAGVSYVLVSQHEVTEARIRLRWIEESGEVQGSPPRLVPVRSLREAWEFISEGSAGSEEIEATENATAAAQADSGHVEGASVDPQEETANLLPLSPAFERVIGISAGGAHHLLLLGPRGTGKSHALEWLSALQPPAPPRVRLHWALLQELGKNQPAPSTISSEPAPIRRVSAHVRPSALVGGASPLHIRPGEFSLAHGGLLIADEFPEWGRDAREAFREPLERGVVTLTRAQGSLELPARFTLAANGNLCPCGGWPAELPLPPSPECPGAEGRPRKPPRCKCSHGERTAYTHRLSGPVLDRIDIVFVGAISQGEKASIRTSRERQRELRARVNLSRRLTARLWGDAPGRLSQAELERLLEERPQWREWLDRSAPLSLRGRHKLLRVALSLAAWDAATDLLKSESDSPPNPSGEPGAHHFLEAALYRPERFGLCE